MIEIKEARPEDLPTVRALFLEYAQSLDFDLGFQGFEQELASLPGVYARPNGCIFLANIEGKVAGCIALKPLAKETGEIKRLYISTAFQGRGLGKLLTEKILQEAYSIGYKKIRLDTVPAMIAAIKLYRSFGFYEIPAYRENPIAGALFFEKKL